LAHSFSAKVRSKSDIIPACRDRETWKLRRLPGVASELGTQGFQGGRNGGETATSCTLFEPPGPALVLMMKEELHYSVGHGVQPWPKSPQKEILPINYKGLSGKQFAINCPR
jgi:hypothetical protein